MLPVFKYHPDPIATGVIKRSSRRCSLCASQRGYEYILPVRNYELSNENQPQVVCPWCISDGSVAKHLGVKLTASLSFRNNDLSEDVIAEVTERTPSYRADKISEEFWACCCNDACSFLGDLLVEEIHHLSFESFRLALDVEDVDEAYFEKYKSLYHIGVLPALFKWGCLHCDRETYSSIWT